MNGDTSPDNSTHASGGFGCLSVLLRLGLCVLLVVFAAALVMTGFVAQDRGKLAAVEGHLGAHSVALSDALRTTIGDHEAGSRIAPSRLPEPLRAPGLIGAWVGREHVTLVVAANPDTDRGFRVWLDKQADDYQDRETDLPGVYRYSYCDDFEPSPTNQPW